MRRPLLTVLAEPASLPWTDQGIQRLELPDATAASADRALAAARAPVALRLRAGERLLPGAPEHAARVAERHPHRSWWWAFADAADAAAAPHREDLLPLLLGHDRPLPVTLFRPASVAARGGFAHHDGPAFAYADACARLVDRVLPGRIAEPLIGSGATDESLSLRVDRCKVAASFADRCQPSDRDAVWVACTRALAELLRFERQTTGKSLRLAA